MFLLEVSLLRNLGYLVSIASKLSNSLKDIEKYLLILQVEHPIMLHYSKILIYFS
jgi:hypothetical protein